MLFDIDSGRPWTSIALRRVNLNLLTVFELLMETRSATETSRAAA